MKNLIVSRSGRRSRLFFSLFSCSLVACCLCVSCKGGGGGGGGDVGYRDPMEGEGSLITVPSQDELGMATPYIVPEGYTCSQLSMTSNDVDFAAELRATAVKAIEGTVTGSLNLLNGGLDGDWSIEGSWVHQGVNKKDVIQDVMMECWDNSAEDSNVSFAFNNLDLTINARSETSESILLTGTVSRGTLTAYKNNNSYPYDLTGATFTFTVKR